MINVLTHGGAVPAALGIHGLTAVVIAISGLLILWETRQRSAVAAPTAEASAA